MPDEDVDVRVRMRDKRKFISDAGEASKAVEKIGTTSRTSTDELTRNSKRGVGSLKKLALGAGAAALGILSISGAKNAIDVTLGLAKTTVALTRNLGLTNKEASQWAASATARGVDTDALSTSFTALSKNVEAARRGDKAAIAHFRQLGISPEQLRTTTDFGDILGLVAGGLGKMEGGSRRAALAQSLLGRSSQTTLPIFTQGRKSMQENLELADKYGVTLGGKPLENLNQLRRAQREMEFAQLGWQVTFATKIAPALAWLIGLVGKGTLFLRKHATFAKVAAVAVGILGGALVTAKLVHSLWDSSLAKGIVSLGKYLFVTKTATGATRAQAAAQWLLNIALSANPIGIIILALVALGIAFVILWKKSARFRAIVTGAFDAVRGAASRAWNWIKEHWPLLLVILTGPFGLAFLAIKRWGGDIVSWFRRLPGRLKAAGGGLWDWIKTSFKSAMNAVLGWWNGLSFSVNVPDVLPGPDRITMGTPNIPLLGQGGDIMRSGAAIVGERGPELAWLPQAARVQPLEEGDSGIVSALLALADRPVQVLMPDGRVLAETTAGYTAGRLARR